MRLYLFILVAFGLLNTKFCSAQNFVNAIWNKGDTTLVIESDTFFISDTSGVHLMTSWYTLSNDTFRFIETSPSSSCPGSDTAVYTYTISNDTMTFTKIEDTCTARIQPINVSAILIHLADVSTCTFNGGGDGSSWSSGSNWSCGSKPDLTTTDVVIPNGFSVINDGGDDMSIENNRDLTISGSLDWESKKIEIKSEGSKVTVNSGGNLTDVNELLFNSNSTGEMALGSTDTVGHLKVDDGCSLSLEVRCLTVLNKLENLSDGGIYGLGCINYEGAPGDFANSGSGGIFGCTDPNVANCSLDGSFPLYVEWDKLELRKINDRNELHWRTYAEINHDHFIIQGSSNGENFENLDVIHSGDSPFGRVYKYTISIGDLYSYFRIVAVDVNGLKDYSNVVYAGEYLEDQISIYPNPNTEGLLFIQLGANKPLSWTLTSATGDFILESSVSQDTDLIEYNTSQLKPGIYFIQLDLVNYVVHQKLIIK